MARRPVVADQPLTPSIWAFRFPDEVTPWKGVELRKLEPFARTNHGLVTLAAAVVSGVSVPAWYRACADGHIELVHPGVARLLGAPVTPVQRVAAAVLAAGLGAMASHRSALLLWDVPRPDRDPVDVTLPARARRSRLRGVVIHRPRDVVDLAPTRRRNVRTSKLLRALCDLGAVDPTGAHPAVGHVVTNGIASPAALRWALESPSRQGRRGIRALRDALDDWLFDGKALDSELERRMKRLAERYRLPPMTFHSVVCGYEVDFLIDDTPIVLECDGWEFHDKRRDKFERDRHRRVVLTAAGWIVVPFTWQMLNRQPQWVATRVVEAVRTWAPHLLGQSGSHLLRRA